jgi:hypothetical protein
MTEVVVVVIDDEVDDDECSLFGYLLFSILIVLIR